jgi:hypothetical protein
MHERARAIVDVNGEIRGPGFQTENTTPGGHRFDDASQTDPLP